TPLGRSPRPWRNVAGRQPLLVVLDDLHWADTPSLLLLESLAREVGAARVLVVGTFRDVEVVPEHPLFDTLGALARAVRTAHRAPGLRRSRPRAIRRDDDRCRAKGEYALRVPHLRGPPRLYPGARTDRGGRGLRGLLRHVS